MLIVPSNTTAEPVAGFIFTAAAEVTVIAPVDVVIFIAASPVAISSAFKDDAVILPPEIVPPTVRFPLVVTAPFDAIVIALVPSV
jgi:hypothetical protein